MFERLFNWGKKDKEPEATTIQPNTSLGRYSDNNKTKEKVAKWTESDNLYKDKKYMESLQSFFDYLKDDELQNVEFNLNGNGGTFSLYQGSKMVRGVVGPEKLSAEISIAKMPNAGVAVMRRLLDQNFNLYYSRYAIKGDLLCMKMDSDVNAANPNKLYYGLKELATKADKQDDLLVQDFSQLEAIDTEHIQTLSEKEKEVKYNYFIKWINDALAEIEKVDADKFQGGIAYQLLSLMYRIDFLIVPEGKLLRELEEIYSIYWKADNRPTVEKNRDMIAAFKKQQIKTKEEIFPYLFLSKSTFSITAPTVFKNVTESIHKANDNSIWYKNNNYETWANIIVEYGIGFAQYSYSLPRPIYELYVLFMQVNYANYFTDLGFTLPYFNNGILQKEAIVKKIKNIINHWKIRYEKLELNTENIIYANLLQFNFSFCNELELLNFE